MNRVISLKREMKESSEGVVPMSEEDDEELMTELFKACYHFEIDIPSDKTRIVPMLQLAQKYQFNSLIPTLVSHLEMNIDINTNVLQCLNLLNLDSDAQLKPVKERLKVVLQGASLDTLERYFLTLNFDQWRRVLQLMANRENRLIAYDAVQSWISADPQNRSVHSFELSNIAKSAAKKQAPIPPPSFDPQYCGTRATLSNDNKRIKKDQSGKFDWNCSAMGTAPCKEFSVRLVNNCQSLMVGVAPKTSSSFKKEGKNFRTCGWYLYCSTGGLYSQNDDNNKQYLGQACNQNGTVIGVKLSDSGDLSYSVNGEDKGVAFPGLPNDDLYPAFDLATHGCEFEFL